MGDIDCGDCDCGDCNCGDCDCSCGDGCCGEDCFAGCCKCLTCNGCNCDCCGDGCCDCDSEGHRGGCYFPYFCCIIADWDCCENNNRRTPSRENATTSNHIMTNQNIDTILFTNTQNVSPNRRNQTDQNDGSMPKEVITEQPPTYEEAISMNGLITTQPQPSQI